MARILRIGGRTRTRTDAQIFHICVATAKGGEEEEDDDNGIAQKVAAVVASVASLRLTENRVAVGTGRREEGIHFGI